MKQNLSFPSDIFMCETSFVAFDQGELIVMAHIPMYKTFHLMKLLEYQPTPIMLANGSNQQIFIRPSKPIVAVDNDLTLYTVYSKEEIHHECENIHNQFHCKNKHIPRDTRR